MLTKYAYSRIGREHHALVDDLLHLLEDLAAGAGVDLDGLRLEESVHLGIAAVGVEAAGDGVLLEPRRRIAGGAASREDDVLEGLLAVLLEEGRALEQAQLQADADGAQVIDHWLADARARECLGRQLAAVEAIGIARLGEELTGARWDRAGRAAASSRTPAPGG